MDTLRFWRLWMYLWTLRRAAASPAGGRHVALFAWALPPNSNPGVHRPLSIVQRAAAAGWQVSTFQGEVPENQSQHGDELLAKVPSNVQRHIVAAADLSPSYRLTPQIDGGFANALAMARDAIASLAMRPPSVVLASGPPFYVFVAAMLVARHFRVPLVLDYRDEWSECPFAFVAKARDNRSWEARCLRAAAAVIFTTESHRRHQVDSFKALTADKTFVVPNGWVPEDFVEAEVHHPVEHGGRLHISHVGTLAEHSAPDAFLRTLADVLSDAPALRRRLTVRFIGRRSPSADAALQRFPYPEVLEVTDHVSKRDAARYVRQSDALLLLAKPELERYLPGKLFDYVAARRPVLVFGHAGEASDLVSRLDIGGLVQTDDAAGLAGFISALSGYSCERHDAAVTTWLDEHRRDVLADRLLDILEAARAPDGGG